MKELSDYLVTSLDSFALLLALLANSTLLYLIHRRTPDFLRPYAQILRIHCVTDIGCDVVVFLIGPQVYPLNHRLYYSFKGIWKAKDPAEMLRQIHILNSATVYVPAFMAPIDFGFRWLLICRKHRMTSRQLALYTISAILLALLVGCPYFLGLTRTDAALFSKEEMDYLNRTVELNGNGLIAIFIAFGFRPYLIIALLNVIVSVEYTFIGYTVYQITKTTANELGRTASPETIAVANRHIARIMILQASVPLITLLPISATVTAAFAGTDWPQLGAVATLRLPVIRPTATILIVPHYRCCVLCYLGLAKYGKETAASMRSQLANVICLGKCEKRLSR